MTETVRNLHLAEYQSHAARLREQARQIADQQETITALQARLVDAAEWNRRINEAIPCLVEADRDGCYLKSEMHQWIQNALEMLVNGRWLQT